MSAVAHIRIMKLLGNVSPIQRCARPAGCSRAPPALFLHSICHARVLSQYNRSGAAWVLAAAATYAIWEYNRRKARADVFSKADAAAWNDRRKAELEKEGKR